ncbi:MAG: choice-of-anchor A family protein [Moraxellaceae bacterium]|nr:choice-of-anchor A family protein [Moraxellaceae bacterium]
MRFNKRWLLACLLATSAGGAHALAVDLGVAGQFNAFVFNDFTTTAPYGAGTDAQGAVAAGGNLTLNGPWSVGLKDTFSSGGKEYAVVTGGSLNWNTSGTLYGNAYVGGGSSLGGGVTFLNGGQVLNGSSPVNFAQAQTYLTNLSTSVAGWANTGSVAYNGSGIQLTGSGGALEVFNIDGSKLGPADHFVLSGVGSSAQIVINVLGSGSYTLDNMDSSLFDSSRTLFNFVDAVGLYMTGTSPHFSILAPDATITGQWGHVEGTVVAKNWNAQTQLNMPSSSGGSSSGGQIPAPAPLLLIGAALSAMALVRRR